MEYFHITPDRGFLEDPVSSFLDGLTLTLNRAGHQERDATAQCGDRIGGDFEIIFLVGGESTITIGNLQRQVHPGDLVLIPPFTKNKIQTTRENPHDNFWFHFDLYPVYRHTGFLDRMGCSSGNGSLLHIGLANSLPHMASLAGSEMIERRPGFHLVLKSVLLNLIIAGMRQCLSEQVSPGMAAPIALTPLYPVLDRAFEYIRQHIGERFFIPDLCRHLAVSESFLDKVFKEILNTSPGKYIQFMKIKHAEQLLKVQGLSVLEVSNRLGFSSPFYFSSVFRRHFGLSPTRYLRQCN